STKRETTTRPLRWRTGTRGTMTIDGALLLGVAPLSSVTRSVSDGYLASLHPRPRRPRRHVGLAGDTSPEAPPRQAGTDTHRPHPAAPRFRGRRSGHDRRATAGCLRSATKRHPG